MKVRVSSAAAVASSSSSEPITSRAALALLHGTQIDVGAELSCYIDEDDLLDRGVAGGAITLAVDSDGVRVNIDYASPEPLEEEQLDTLLRFTLGQWSDGAGEGGFEVETRAGVLLVQPSDAREHSIVRQFDDGRPRPGRPIVANLAAHGEADDVRAALAEGHSVDAVRGGYSALCLAILRGRADIALDLIDAGADVLAVDPHGSPILHMVATARELSDEDGARVARALVARGCRVDILDKHGRSAAALAEIRRKPLVVAALRERS